MGTQSINKEFGEEKICVSESFTVDMEHISHLVEKDLNANSRITLQRHHSRKGSLKKTNFNTVNEKDANIMETSPRGASMPQKPTVRTTDHSTSHIPNQNIMVAANSGVAATGGATSTDSKGFSRRFSFRRSSSSSWTIDPRRIPIFFATLSCMGTTLLICLTLFLTKFTGEDKASS